MLRTVFRLSFEASKQYGNLITACGLWPGGLGEVRVRVCVRVCECVCVCAGEYQL